MARAYARFGLENPNHYRFMFMTPHLKEDQRPSPAGEQAYSLVHRTVEEAIAAGRFRTIDAHAAAQTLWSSLHGVVALLITYTPDKFPCAPAREDLVEQVIENGLRGVLKAPA
jgi:hypothetical protein